jgi:hypothetical protein
MEIRMATAALSAGILLFQPNAAQAQITFGLSKPIHLDYHMIGNFGPTFLLLLTLMETETWI